MDAISISFGIANLGNSFNNTKLYCNKMKKSFKEIYSELDNLETPKQKFLREIAELTGRKLQTVKQWLCGSQVPSEDTIQLLADYFNVEPDSLFPNL